MSVLNKSFAYQFLAANTAAIIFFVVGCWVAWPSVVIKKLSEDLPDSENIGIRLNKYQISWMVSFLDLGNALSPIFAGFLMKKIGRKMTLILNAILCLPTWLLVTSKRIECLYFARLSIGMAKGVAYTTLPVFIGEISENHCRGTLVSIPHGLQIAGSLIILLFGNYMTFHQLNLCLSILPLVSLLLLTLIPETPHFYAAKNDREKMEKSLMWYRGLKEDVTEEMGTIIRKTEEEQQNESGYLELITNKANLMAFTMVMVTSLAQRLGGITSIITYSSTLLPKLDNNYFGPDQCVLVFMIIMSASNFLQAPLVDFLGRKPLGAFSAACGSLLMLTTGLFYLHQSHLLDYKYLPYITSLAYSACYYGMGALPAILVSELFPINVRCQASSCSSVALALGSFITTKFHLLITKAYGQHVIFFIYAFVHFLALGFNSLFLIETKRKTLSEIQEKLRRRIGKK